MHMFSKSSSRCVTIHGSHEVHVKNNVAHDTYGHCFFLEDGGEKNNVFEGNLGLTTRRGFLTLGDDQVFAIFTIFSKDAIGLKASNT